MKLQDIFHELESMEDCLEEDELELLEEARTSFFAGGYISFETKTNLEELIETAYERYG